MNGTSATFTLTNQAVVVSPTLTNQQGAQAMTTTQLSRVEVRNLLLQAGLPSTTVTTNTGLTMPLVNAMVGVGCAESDLVVEAQNKNNPDGSIDNGLFQINSRAWPQYDPDRLRSEPLYACQAGVTVYTAQGLKAWYAYQLPDGTPGPYVKKMPPGQGGKDLALNYVAPLLVKSWQAFLNTATPKPATPLTVDGGFGPRTEAATVAWKTANHNDGTLKIVTGRTWTKAGLF